MKAYLILDGTLLPIDRIAAERPGAEQLRYTTEELNAAGIAPARFGLSG